MRELSRKIYTIPIFVLRHGPRPALYRTGKERGMKILITKDELIELLKISEPDVRLDIAEAIKFEIEKVKEPKPKEEPKKKTKIIDHGKIVACYKGGRSVAWIADDMKIAPQTVINHLVKEGLYQTKAERSGLSE